MFRVFIAPPRMCTPPYWSVAEEGPSEWWSPLFALSEPADFLSSRDLEEILESCDSDPRTDPLIVLEVDG